MSNEDLQVEKLKHEVDKIRLEIDNLRRPMRAYWRNPASYLTALTVVLGVAAYMGQSYVSDARAERAKADLALAELKKKEFEAAYLELEAKRKTVEADTARLKSESEALWSAYGQADKALEVKKAELAAITQQLDAAQQEMMAKGQKSVKLAMLIDDVNKLKLAAVPVSRQLGARIYIQVSRQAEVASARELGGLLAGAGVMVPAVEVVGEKAGKLDQSELRYFWDADKTEAEAIAAKISAAGKRGPVALVLPQALKGKARPRQFELWLKPQTE